MDQDPVTAVPFEDCDYSDAQELLHRGVPYTGAVVEHGPEGQVVSLQWFRHGIPDGLSRLWDHQGRLRSETDHAFGRRRAFREWHPDGLMRREVIYGGPGQAEVIRDRAWDPSGRPVDPA